MVSTIGYKIPFKKSENASSILAIAPCIVKQINVSEENIPEEFTKISEVTTIEGRYA